MTTPNLQLVEPPDFASPVAAEERDSFRALDSTGPGVIAVTSRTTIDPPGSPVQGTRFLVPPGASGVWAPHERHLAYYIPTGWAYRAPRHGWVALVLDEQPPAGKLYEYDGTEWVPFQFPADQIAYSDSSPGLGAATVQEAIDILADESENHETRIVALEAGGGPGGSAWQNVVTQPFSANTTGFTSNGSGAWAISGGVLDQSSNTTNGAVFRYTTTVPYAAVRLRCEVNMLSTGSPSSTQLVGFYLGPAAPSATPTNSIVFSLRRDSGVKKFQFDKFGAGAIYGPAYTFPLDTFVPIEVIISGTRVLLVANGVAIGSFVSADVDFIGYQDFGLFTYGSLAQFRNFTIDVLV